MDREKIITHLKSQRTWRLIFLSIITLGIYTAHYIKRQTCIFNKYLDREQKISSLLAYLIMFISYERVIVLLLSVFMNQLISEDMNFFRNLLRFILVIVWAFQVRNRINKLLLLSANRALWLNRGLTFFFTIFYINYMINSLNENSDKEEIMAAPPPLPEC
jgi:hypothetical protein